MKTLAIASLVLAGCNQVWGLHETGSVDARVSFFDAGPDAASTCGDPSVPPAFSTELHQVVFSNVGCGNYQTSSIGLAFAACSAPPDYMQQFREGHVGDVSDLVLTRGDLDEGPAIFSPELAPEGNEVYAARYDMVTGNAVWRFERDSTGVWIRKAKSNIPFTTSKRMSTVSRGPRRRMFVVVTNTQFVEYEQQTSDTWAVVHNYTASDFGLLVIFTIYLSADGRRVLLNGIPQMAVSSETHTFYASRPSIDDMFSTAVLVPSAPVASDLFMTEDCDRVYFSGLSSVFYSRRL